MATDRPQTTQIAHTAHTAQSASAIDEAVSQAKAHLARLTLPRYPLLDDLVSATGRARPEPVLRFPSASCLAAGGDASATVSLTAAWDLLLVATRLLDDLYDRDRPGQLWERVGDARTFNAAGALLALAFDQISTADELAPARRVQVIMEISHATIRMAEGEDQDLRGDCPTLEDYWALVARTNGAAFAMACAAGGRCAGADAVTVEALRDFGMHLGIGMQILDDVEGIWLHGPGVCDLERRRISLPVLFAMRDASSAASAVRELWASRTSHHESEVDELRRLLDSSGAREFSQVAARDEITAAVACLASLRDNEGSAALRSMAESIGG